MTNQPDAQPSMNVDIDRPLSTARSGGAWFAIEYHTESGRHVANTGDVNSFGGADYGSNNVNAIGFSENSSGCPPCGFLG